MADEKDKPEKSIVRPPFVFEVDEDLSGKYGFKDAHGEVNIKVPKALSVILMKKHLTLTLTLEKAKKLREGLTKFIMWGELPDYQRQRDGAD